MPTRTFKLTGSSPESADITVTFNGSQVFTGTAGTDGNLCEFTADGSLTGNIATTVTINSGNEVTIEGLTANYTLRERPEYVDVEGNTVEAVTADDVVNQFHYLNDADGNYGTSSVSSNAFINGEGVTIESSPGGQWHFTLDNSDVLNVDYHVSAIPGT